MAVLAISTVGVVLVVWAAVLAVLVAALALGTRRRRPTNNDLPERRGPHGDRRQGDPDRRMGLPDLRVDKQERRSGAQDRRVGTRDRRRPLGAVG